MSAAKASPWKKELPTPQRKASDEARVHFLPPLRPRRGWFIGLLIAFFAWIVFLLVLYFRTVHGHTAS
jgi:hypothetical protein